MCNLEDYLDEAKILALPDVHSEPTARRAAEELLKSGKVKVFFIEFQNVNYKIYGQETSLNQAARAIEQAEDEHDASNSIANYFNDMNKSDAEPTLLDLAGVCVFRGAVLRASDPDYTKLMEKHGTTDEHWLFEAGQGGGLEARDKCAARIIIDYLAQNTSPATGRLMMWGANHLEEGSTLFELLKDRIHVASIGEVKTYLGESD